MFKIPDWEDVSNSNTATFNRKAKIKNLITQKSSIKNGITKIENKIGKLSKNKQTTQKKFSQKEKLEKHKHFVKPESPATNKHLRRDQRANGFLTRSSLLKQNKNQKNKEMMNRRLQNKSININTKNTAYKRHDTNKIKANIKSRFNQNKSNKNKQIITKINEDIAHKENNSDDEMVNSINDAKTNKKKNSETDSLEIQNFDSDMLDEVVINAKKKRINESLQNEDDEHELFNEIDSKAKFNRKKEMFRKILEVNSRRNHIEVKGNKLRERMLERLKAAQFRYLNEKLYTSSGSDAQQLFQSDPAAFQTYHQGYQQQLKKWPINPLDVIVKKIAKMPKTHIVADMGCGEAALSRRVPHKVRSFDLVASTPGVEACDMAHTPLLAESIDVAVYCLALMGTDLTQYLVEANRVLKMGGHLLIAEVESRFDDVEAFTKEVQRLGFKLKNLDKSNKVFFFMEFTKIREPPAKKSKLPVLTLKPCLYKRR